MYTMGLIPKSGVILVGILVAVVCCWSNLVDHCEALPIEVSVQSKIEDVRGESGGLRWVDREEDSGDVVVADGNENGAQENIGNEKEVDERSIDDADANGSGNEESRVEKNKEDARNGGEVNEHAEDVKDSEEKNEAKAESKESENEKESDPEQQKTENSQENAESEENTGAQDESKEASAELSEGKSDSGNGIDENTKDTESNSENNSPATGNQSGIEAKNNEEKDEKIDQDAKPEDDNESESKTEEKNEQDSQPESVPEQAGDPEAEQEATDNENNANAEENNESDGSDAAVVNDENGTTDSNESNEKPAEEEPKSPTDQEQNSSENEAENEPMPHSEEGSSVEIQSVFHGAEKGSIVASLSKAAGQANEESRCRFSSHAHQASYESEGVFLGVNFVGCLMADAFWKFSEVQLSIRFGGESTMNWTPQFTFNVEDVRNAGNDPAPVSESSDGDKPSSPNENWESGESPSWNQSVRIYIVIGCIALAVFWFCVRPAMVKLGTKVSSTVASLRGYSNTTTADLSAPGYAPANSTTFNTFTLENGSEEPSSGLGDWEWGDEEGGGQDSATDKW